MSGVSHSYIPWKSLYPIVLICYIYYLASNEMKHISPYINKPYMVISIYKYLFFNHYLYHPIPLKRSQFWLGMPMPICRRSTPENGPRTIVLVIRNQIWVQPAETWSGGTKWYQGDGRGLEKKNHRWDQKAQQQNNAGHFTINPGYFTILSQWSLVVNISHIWNWGIFHI